MNPGTLPSESRFRVAVAARCEGLAEANQRTVAAALFPEVAPTEISVNA